MAHVASPILFHETSVFSTFCFLLWFGLSLYLLTPSGTWLPYLVHSDFQNHAAALSLGWVWASDKQTCSLIGWRVSCLVNLSTVGWGSFLSHLQPKGLSKTDVTSGGLYWMSEKVQTLET